MKRFFLFFIFSLSILSIFLFTSNEIKAYDVDTDDFFIIYNYGGNLTVDPSDVDSGITITDLPNYISTLLTSGFFNDYTLGHNISMHMILTSPLYHFLNPPYTIYAVTIVFNLESYQSLKFESGTEYYYVFDRTLPTQVKGSNPINNFESWVNRISTQFNYPYYNNVKEQEYEKGFEDGKEIGYKETHTLGFDGSYGLTMTSSYPYRLGHSDGNISYQTGYRAGAVYAYQNGFDSFSGLNTNDSYPYSQGRNEIYYNVYENGFEGFGGLRDGWYQDSGSYPYGLGYQKGLDADNIEAYNKGYDDGSKDSFSANLHVWIVPSIILVLIVGGFISFRQVRNRD